MIPLWLKLLTTLAVAGIVVVYAVRYPLTNFLWFSNIGLIGTTIAMWLHSALLASMMALSILMPSLLWNTSFFGRLFTGRSLAGATDYMFDPALPLWLRGLSLYHVALPVLAVWLVMRLGYEPAALVYQFALACTLIVVTRLIGPTDNVNFVYGPDRRKRSSMHPVPYLASLMLAQLLLALLPGHLLFSAVSQARADTFATPQAAAPRVLWDAAHFNAHLWGMDAFRSIIRQDGFRLEYQKTPWDDESLQSADIVIIPGPLGVDRDGLLAQGLDHYWWSDEGRQDAFTSGEVVALVSWVKGGGALLLILDHAPFADAARKLSEALGVEARNSMTWDGNRLPPGYDPIKSERTSKILFNRGYGSLGDHPILDGRDASERVDAVATFVGSSIVGPLGSVQLLSLSDESFDYWKDPPERGGGEHRISAAGRAQAVAFELGEGRVVVVAEFTVFQERWGGPGDPDGEVGFGMAYAGAQDRQFATNVLRWLARVIP